MTLHFLSEEIRCREGIGFAARTELRLGVVLLGARMTLAQVGDLGLGPVTHGDRFGGIGHRPGALFARVLGLPRDLGLLADGAVAICGASAALALSAVITSHENSERNTTHIVVRVTTLSTMAMVIYPLIAGGLELSNTQAGIFLGSTIHNVAQVVGGRLYVTVSPNTGQAKLEFPAHTE